MDRLRPAWEKLYSPERHTIFQSFAWNRLAAERFGNKEVPLVVYAECDSGATIVPACVCGRAKLSLLGEMLFDYRAVLHDGDPSTLQAAFSYVAELDLPLELAGLRESDLLPFEQLEPTIFCNAPGVKRQAVTAEQFAAEHSRLGRFFRRLAKQRVELQQFFGDQAQLIRWIYERKGEQFSGSSLEIFSDPARVDFMVAAAALDPGRFEIFTFTAANRVIAALVTLRDGHVRRFYTVWFDQEWAQYSPGTVLVFAITQRSLAEGLDCDYMTGEQPHKLRLATGATRLFRVSGRLKPALGVVSAATEAPVAPEILPQAAD